MLTLLICRDLGADIDDPIVLNLPQQPLTQSVISLGKAGGISIVGPSYLLNGLTGPALNGKFTPREALIQLLADTHLTTKEINHKVVALVPKERHPAVADGAPPIFEELVIIGHRVTGSLLDRTDLQGSSPVDIITARELELSGSQNVAEFLKFIPAVSGNSTSTAISNGGDGTATVTLRGLPANNTLVLLNGKRIATEGLDGDSVDLNSIPSAAVERIEILKDGASAIYGTDAIAGVVNIIMKRDYEGFQLEQYFGSSYKNDLETNSTHLMWGYAGERASFLISAQHFDQNGLFSRERSLSSNADGRARGGADKRSTATPNARITLPDERVVILDQGNPGHSAEDFRAATDEDRFNFLSQTSTISPSTRQSIYLAGHLQISDDANLSLDANFNKTEATITLASTPLFTAFENTPIIVAADNIHNPFGQDIDDVRRRVIELDPRRQKNTTEVKRVSLTLDGYWGNTSWELNGIWSETDAKEFANNLLSEARVQRALGPAAECRGIAVDGCEPLNVFGPPSSIDETQLAYLQTYERTEGNSRLYGLNGNLSAAMVELPSGPIYAAAGFDARRESVNSRTLFNGDGSPAIGSVSKNPTRGSRRIYEGFLELQVPIVKQIPLAHSLDLELALRHSKYNDFGKNTSPKIGLRYRPVPQLLLRSTYSEGFRAPNLGELYTGSFQSQLPLTDPCSFADNVGVLPGCTTQSDPARIQFLTTFAGEPNLNPETSKSYTFGVVWTPWVAGDLLVSLDQFSIDQENIVSANAQLILDRNARFNEFSDFVSRDANGEINRIFSPFINIGVRKISGVDTAIRYTRNTSKLGSFTYSLNASYLDEYAFRLAGDSPFENLEGTFEDAANEGSGALPKWKANTGIFWSFKQVEFNYSINYVSSVRENIPFTDGERREIDSWLTHDAQFSYKAGQRHQLKLSLGIDNIWNEAPPFAASAFNDNYDARTYDIKGQFVYGTLLYSFY